MNVGHGWTVGPSGYAAYVTSLSSDERVLFTVYGLKVVGLGSNRGRERQLSIRMERNEVEMYIKRTIEALRQSKEKLNFVMRTNIHEVRSINANIYNAVYRLKENLDQSIYRSDRDFPIVRNIEELSKILKTRTDVLDVLSNPALLQAPRTSIPIYRAFDRVVRSLTPTAEAESVKLRLTGSSTGRVIGISLFDVIPYLMIENAIKYAPRETNVEVRFDENSSRVDVQVRSTGPAVEREEMERMFILGFRGKHARRVTTEGTGFGMYLLRMLVELHDGGSIRFFSRAGIANNKYDSVQNYPHCHDYDPRQMSRITDYTVSISTSVR